MQHRHQGPNGLRIEVPSRLVQVNPSVGAELEVSDRHQDGARGGPQRLRCGHATIHHGRLQHDIDLDLALSESDGQLLDGEVTPPGLHPPDPSLAATSGHNRLTLDSSQTEGPGRRRHVQTVIAAWFRHDSHLTTPGRTRARFIHPRTTRRYGELRPPASVPHTV
jgi:hypothetical protein